MGKMTPEDKKERVRETARRWRNGNGRAAIKAKKKRYCERYRERELAKQRRRNARRAEAEKARKSSPEYIAEKERRAAAAAQRRAQAWSAKRAARVANPAWQARERLRRMITTCRERAKAKGVPFSLSVDDLTMPTVCPILGIELTPGVNGDACPSVDRIQPELGYVRGNVAIISVLANRLKSSATEAQLRLIADYVAARS